MPVSDTTLPALQELLLNTVKGVTPSTTRGQGRDRWRNRRGNKRGPASNNTRAFHLELFGDREAADDMPITTASETRDVTCVVITDYSLPQQHAYPVIGEDNADLRDAFSDLHLDGSNGIWFVRAEDFTDPPEDSDGPFQIAHEFTVTYQRSRTYGS